MHKLKCKSYLFPAVILKAKKKKKCFTRMILKLIYSSIKVYTTCLLLKILIKQ